jgi:hypothetical protein
MDCAAFRQYGTVRQYERQCMAVHTAAVCGSALSNVWQYTCGSVRLSGSAAVRGFVRQCARQCAAVRAVVCGSVWMYVAVSPVVCGNVRGSVRAVRAIVYGSVRGGVRLYGSAAMCSSALGSVWQCAWQCCAAVRQCGSVLQCAAVRAAVCGSACGSVYAVVL